MSQYTLHHGNCLDILPQLRAGSVHTCITSPPYLGLRDYQAEGQLGQERSVANFAANLVAVFRQVRRVLRPDGTLWLNLGDSYCRSDSKRQRLKKGDMMGAPWAVALALREDGWYLRSDCIWQKSNCLPESVTDRPTKSHEYLFLLSANRRYYYDATAIREPLQESSLKRHKAGIRNGANEKPLPVGDTRIARVRRSYRDTSPDELRARGRNKRSVWTTSCSPARGIAHFATFPEALIRPCVLAGSPVGGVVLDPFAGSGTTGMAALRHGRDFVGVDLNGEYVRLAEERLQSLANK